MRWSIGSPHVAERPKSAIRWIEAGPTQTLAAADGRVLSTTSSLIRPPAVNHVAEKPQAMFRVENRLGENLLGGSELCGSELVGTPSIASP